MWASFLGIVGAQKHETWSKKFAPSLRQYFIHENMFIQVWYVFSADVGPRWSWGTFLNFLRSFRHGDMYKISIVTKRRQKMPKEAIIQLSVRWEFVIILEVVWGRSRGCSPTVCSSKFGASESIKYMHQSCSFGVALLRLSLKSFFKTCFPEDLFPRRCLTPHFLDATVRSHATLSLTPHWLLTPHFDAGFLHAKRPLERHILKKETKKIGQILTYQDVPLPGTIWSAFIGRFEVSLPTTAFNQLQNNLSDPLTFAESGFDPCYIESSLCDVIPVTL